MGSGFTDFTAGDVLTADQVDGYLMRQTIMTFADSSARDSALSGVLDEGMHAYLEDTNSLTYYTGSAWKTVYSDWTSFTPAWGNLSEGDGTNVGMYRYINGDLHVIAKLTFGSSTSVSGTITLTLPNSETAASTPAAVDAEGTASSYDDNATATTQGIARCSSGATTVAFFTDGGSPAEWDASLPIGVWATSDIIRVDIVVPL